MGLSDGCAEQYKSKFTAYEMTYFCANNNIDEMVHTYAPTAQFKCCCDSAGNDTKMFMKRAERAENVRATNGWEVFKYLHTNMPEPLQKKKNKLQFQLDHRHQLYVIKEEHLQQEMKDWILNTNNPNIILLKPAQGERDGKGINGMRNIYQLRVSKDMRDRQIQYRKVTCACAECMKSNYEACLTMSKWKLTDLKKTSRATRRTRRRDKSDGSSNSDSEISTSAEKDDSNNNVPQITDARDRALLPVHETFAMRKEITSNLALGRTSRLTGRNNNKLLKIY